jgi:hypothetical protein
VVITNRRGYFNKIRPVIFFIKDYLLLKFGNIVELKSLPYFNSLEGYICDYKLAYDLQIGFGFRISFATDTLEGLC